MTKVATFSNNSTTGVLCCDPERLTALGHLFTPLGLGIEVHEAGSPLPGSYWGAPEAGLVGARLHVSPDTPVHSALHEGCHYLCMDPRRRDGLDTDAGSDDLEESAVCFLQVLLADRLPGVGRDRLMADMDTWGYSFRLGHTRAWFEQDAGDARDWLLDHGLIDPANGFIGARRR